MIGLPPSDAGGEKDIIAWALPAVEVPITGASGTVIGVTEFVATDGEPVPTSFVAVTVKVYGVPFVRPVTLMESPVEVAEMLPGFEIAV